MAYAFFAGLDIKDHDATLALVEKEADDPHDAATYHVRRLERIGDLADADEPHERLVDRVQNLLAEAPYTGRTILVVNQTSSLGRAVQGELTERGLTPVGVELTGGGAAAQEGSGLDLGGGDDAAEDAASFFAAERDVAGRLAALERAGRLVLSQDNEEAMSELAHGLQSVRALAGDAEADEDAEAAGEAAQADASTADTVQADVDEADEAPEAGGTPSPSEEAAREERFDPLVISAGLACWLGEERSFDPTVHLGGEAPTTGEAKRLHRPDAAT